MGRPLTGICTTADPDVDLPLITEVYRHARFDWDIEDPIEGLITLVDDYNAAGVKPLVVSTFYGRVPSEGEAEGLAAWAEALQGKILAIEFGNETSYSYQGVSDQGATYAARVVTAYEAIDGLVPLWVQCDSGGTWMADMKGAVSDLDQYVDGWTVHPYGPDYVDRIYAERFAIELFGWTGDIQVTEFGLSSDDGATLTDNYGWPADQTYAQAAAALDEVWNALPGFVKSFFIFQVRDLQDPGNTNQREDYFGAVQSDGSPKGAYTTKVHEIAAASGQGGGMALVAESGADSLVLAVNRQTFKWPDALDGIADDETFTIGLVHDPSARAIALYINGELVEQKLAVEAAFAPDSTLQIGATNSGDDPWEGALGGVGVVAGAWDAEQMDAWHDLALASADELATSELVLVQGGEPLTWLDLPLTPPTAKPAGDYVLELIIGGNAEAVEVWMDIGPIAFLTYSPLHETPDVDDMHLANYGFLEAQAALARGQEPIPGRRKTALAEWHGRALDDESQGASLAVVQHDGALADLVGQRIRLSAKSRTVDVYVHNAVDIGTGSEISLSRRAFAHLAHLATDELRVQVDVLGGDR